MARKFYLIACGILLAVGCGSPRIDTEYDRQHDFSTLRTFDFVPEPEERPEPVPPGLGLLRVQIIESVIAKMESLGFRQAGGEQPDVLIAIHIVGPQWVERRRESALVGSSHFFELAYQRELLTSHHFKEGTLVLDMVDPESSRLLWRGWATRVIDGPDVAGERFREAVHSMLAKFPPK